MSDIKDMVLATYRTAVESTNAIADKILAATVDQTKRVHELRTDPNTTDEKIKAFQEWLETVLAKIESTTAEMDEDIKSRFLSADKDFDVEAAKAQYKAGKEQVQAAINFAKTVPDFSESDLEGLPELKSLRGGTSGGSGSGGRRPRIERLSFATNSEGPWTEVDKDGKTNFTLLAQRLSTETKTKVEVKELQAAAFAEAKTEDLSSLDGRVFTFAHNVGDKTYWVKVQPAVKTVESKDEDTKDETVETEEKDEAVA